MIILHMRNKKERTPITVSISVDADKVLREIQASLACRAEKKQAVSLGKIVETLLLQKHAQEYVEKMLLV